MNSRDARLALLGVAAVAAAAAFLLRDALFHGRVLFWRDIHLVWQPLTEVLVRGWADGELPLWDRFSGFGRPLLADGRAALFYPPTWLFLPLSRGSAYTWFVYLHLVVAGSGAVALGRRLGAGLGPALAGGLGFTVSGPLLSLALMWHQLAGAAWMPWALLAGDIAGSTGSRLAVAAAAGSLALPVLAGSPEYALLTALALPMLVLARAAGADRVRAARRLLAIAALAAALAAPQVLPTLFRARESARAETREGASVWSLHPLRLLEAALPLRLGELPLSPGALREVFDDREPLLHSVHLGTALVGLAFVGGAAAGRTGACLAVLLLAFVGVSLGRNAPFLTLATALVPPLGLLRYPQKAMVPAALAACLLAGMGLAALTRGRASKGLAALAGWLVVPAALLGLLAQLGLAQEPAAAGPAWSWLVGPEGGRRAALASIAAASWQAAALAALPALAVLARLSARSDVSSRALTFALGALLWVPALAMDADLLWTAPSDFWAHRPEVLGHLDLRDHARIYAYEYTIFSPWQAYTNPRAREIKLGAVGEGLNSPAATVRAAHQALHPPAATRWGVPGSFDYDILDLDRPEQKELCRLLRAREATRDHLRLLQIGAVRYAVSLSPGAWWRDLEPIAEEPTLFTLPATVLRVPDPLPRAYTVPRARGARDARDAVTRMLARDFDARREVILAGFEDAPALARDAPDSDGSVAITELRANRVTLETSLARDGFVVLVDAWAPGWSATIDGAPTEILQANGLFRGLRVPAGRHRVQMRYWPPGLTPGLALAGLAVAGFLAAILAVPK